MVIRKPLAFGRSPLYVWGGGRQWRFLGGVEHLLLFPFQYLVLTFVRESIMIVFISFQVRDYIHVVDLADGHIAALRKLDEPTVGMCHEIDMFFVFFAYLVLVDSPKYQLLLKCFV